MERRVQYIPDMTHRVEDIVLRIESVGGVESVVVYTNISEKYNYDFSLPPMETHREILGPCSPELLREEYKIHNSLRFAKGTSKATREMAIEVLKK
ncbi:hypothetical protein RLOatenuis_1940 [Rickettsiales bacterium]|nr:hypothetical protein RLOatenuis_1940 [Rickettsiales bacterium]